VLDRARCHFQGQPPGTHLAGAGEGGGVPGSETGGDEGFDEVREEGKEGKEGTVRLSGLALGLLDLDAGSHLSSLSPCSTAAPAIQYCCTCLTAA